MRILCCVNFYEFMQSEACLKLLLIKSSKKGNFTKHFFHIARKVIISLYCYLFVLLAYWHTLLQKRNLRLCICPLPAAGGPRPFPRCPRVHPGGAEKEGMKRVKNGASLKSHYPTIYVCVTNLDSSPPHDCIQKKHIGLNSAADFAFPDVLPVGHIKILW